MKGLNSSVRLHVISGAGSKSCFSTKKTILIFLKVAAILLPPQKVKAIGSSLR